MTTCSGLLQTNLLFYVGWTDVKIARTVSIDPHPTHFWVLGEHTGAWGRENITFGVEFHWQLEFPEQEGNLCQ